MHGASAAPVTQPDHRGLAFSDLVEARRRLNEDVQRHRASINFFASGTGFHRTAADVAGGGLAIPKLQALDAAKPLSGVTTAATCFESLETALLDPEAVDARSFAGHDEIDGERLKVFASNTVMR